MIFTQMVWMVRKVEMIRLLVLLIVLSISTNAYSVTAWVDNNGVAAWGACQGAPKSGAAACSMATANANADDDDIVYLRTGTYNTSIAPANSGSSGHEITYIAYNSEVVTITGVNLGVDLKYRHYIKVDGIRILSTSYWVSLSYGGKLLHILVYY